MSQFAVFKIVSTAPDSTDQNQVELSLSEIWVSRGGWWISGFETMGNNGSTGNWKQSPADPSDVLGISGKNMDERFWTIKGTSSPLTVGQNGNGKMERGTSKMPEGPFSWKIVAIRTFGTNIGDSDSSSADASSGDSGSSDSADA
jgi:hypothetical protein